MARSFVRELLEELTPHRPFGSNDELGGKRAADVAVLRIANGGVRIEDSKWRTQD